MKKYLGKALLYYIVSMVLLFVTIGAIFGGITMMVLGFKKTGNYQVVGYTEKQDGYKIEGNKITPNIKTEAVFDDDFNNFWMGVGGIPVTLVGIACIIGAFHIIGKLTDEERKRYFTLLMWGPILGSRKLEALEKKKAVEENNGQEEIHS